MLNSENEIKADPGSFRDPASRVYVGKGMVFREIDSSYFTDYDHFMKSGLYQELLDRELIVPHGEAHRDERCAILESEMVPLISYPYEWSFSQIQEAALTTLQINRIAREKGMMLKDATAYNIQWYEGRMRLIDTSSFIRYQPGQPWHPYTQFLRHFACPMLIMKYDHANNGKMSQLFIDGIPIQEAVHRIPFFKRFNTGMVTHILSQSMNFNPQKDRDVKWSGMVYDTLLANLEKFIATMKYKIVYGSDFVQYADLCGYSQEELKAKKQIVDHCIHSIKGENFLDLGCNTGTYSESAANLGKNVIAVDSDHDCIESIYHRYSDGILPLIVNVTNPSPGIGWANRERRPFWDRVGEVDCIMALALVHHLCIRNNIPVGMVLDLFADHAKNLIIEWVPPDDPKAIILGRRKKVPQYDLSTFESEAHRRFNIIGQYPVGKETGRIIYQMKRS
jgi:hypothetical protein